MSARSDPGIDVSYRPFRMEITGRLSIESPFHIGTGDRLSLATDAPVLRRAIDGRPYLPGTSLRGALRDHLIREAPLLGCPKEVVDRFFGKTSPFRQKDSPSAIGRFYVCDALPEAEGLYTEVCDHVCLKPEWGAAAYGAKFDAEIALADDVFFNLFLAYEGDGEKDTELLLFKEAVRALSCGGIRIGGKSGWGYGKIRLLDGYEIRTFNRAKEEGLAKYLKHRLGHSLPCDSSPLDSLEKRSPITVDEGGYLPYHRLEMKLDIQFEGPVLVKFPIPPLKGDHEDKIRVDKPDLYREPDLYWKKGLTEADHTFIRHGQNNQYYLPGASLRGVLRSRAGLICRTLFHNEIVSKRLFGWAKDSQGTGNGEGQKGRIVVEDGLLSGEPDFIYLDHVAIDRLSHAAREGAKFSACALACPLFQTCISISFPYNEWDIVALWGFVLKDLMEGRLWAGSGTSRGYGFIKKANISSYKIDLPAGHDWKIGEKGRVDDKARPGRLLIDYQGNISFSDLSRLWTKANEAWTKLLSQGGEQRNG